MTELMHAYEEPATCIEPTPLMKLHKRLLWVSGEPGYTIDSGKNLRYRCLDCGEIVNINEADY